MPVCIECRDKCSFETIKALVLHLRIVHKYNVLSIYRCGEEGSCLRKFSSIKAFIRHVEEHFKSSDSLTTNESPPRPDQGAMNLVTNDFNDDIIIDQIENNEYDEDLILSTDCFKDSLRNQSDAFVSKFYCKSVLPRNIVQEIIDDTENFLSLNGFMNILKQKVLRTLKVSNTDSSAVNEISEMFDILESPFSHLNTEYKRLQYFMANGYFIAPNEFEFGKQLKQVKTNSGIVHRWVKVTAQHIPLAPVLKKFLELPDSLPSILSYIDYLNLNTSNICNFIQTDAWKKKRSKFKSTDIVLPLFIFFDDFEPNNPLGSHCSKIGGIYVTIACLPPEIASRVENIFLSILFNSKDRDDFPIKAIIAPLIKDLKTLEKDGISVKLSTGEDRQVYFVMGLLLGDNLGIHHLCGYICNFSKSNYRCRYCKIHKNELIKDLQIDESLFRNRINYKLDVLKNCPENTGITGRCALNELESFHITENLEGDILHDFDEGIDHQVMTFILTKLTDSDTGSFTLLDLNRRLNLFNFGTYSALYKTKLFITEENLRNRKLKMSGSEMQCFVRTFGILMGDLVPENNEYWQLYLNLQRVYDIVLSKCVPESSIRSFQYYVTELGRQYLDLSEDNRLTFKFHKIIWHYSTIMKTCGPLANLCVRRFESKNRELKLDSKANMSRVNLIKSLSIKHQLRLCHRFLANSSILSEIEIGAGDSLTSYLGELNSELTDSLKTFFRDLSSVFVPHWINYKGFQFDNYSTVIVDIDDYFGWPLFGEIQNIFISNENVVISCRILETIGFKQHFHAYEVKRTEREVCYNISALADPLPLNILSAPKGGLFIILRYQT